MKPVLISLTDDNYRLLLAFAERTDQHYQHAASALLTAILQNHSCDTARRRDCILAKTATRRNSRAPGGIRNATAEEYCCRNSKLHLHGGKRDKARGRIKEATDQLARMLGKIGQRQ